MCTISMNSASIEACVSGHVRNIIKGNLWESTPNSIDACIKRRVHPPVLLPIQNVLQHMLPPINPSLSQMCHAKLCLYFLVSLARGSFPWGDTLVGLTISTRIRG